MLAWYAQVQSDDVLTVEMYDHDAFTEDEMMGYLEVRMEEVQRFERCQSLRTYFMGEVYGNDKLPAEQQRHSNITLHLQWIPFDFEEFEGDGAGNQPQKRTMADRLHMPQGMHMPHGMHMHSHTQSQPKPQPQPQQEVQQQPLPQPQYQQQVITQQQVLPQPQYQQQVVTQQQYVEQPLSQPQYVQQPLPQQVLYEHENHRQRQR